MSVCQSLQDQQEMLGLVGAPARPQRPSINDSSGFGRLDFPKRLASKNK